MKNELDPRRLNIRTFALEAAALSGEERLARFERLIEESRGIGGETMVTFAARGEMRKDAAGQQEPWMALEAQATLVMECQRCLGPVELPVQFAREFRFVDNEELAAVEDEESEEDVLVTSRNFDLLGLVEDELLMAMPVAPKHAECPQALPTMAADPDFEQANEAKPNPFAALAKLKKDGAG